jgi:nucleotidyltransferase/DNA polymerase involved in DNA repair
VPTSIDEGFLDFTDMPRVFNCPDASTLINRIKREVTGALGITISAGLGSSRWLAKLATESSKPDGFREVPFEAERKFLEQIPLEALAGIAKRRARALRAFGAFTLGDVAQLPLSLIEQHFGFFGLELWLLANGKLRETLEPEFKPRTTISSATTLPRNEPDYENALLFLLDQAERVSTTFFRENLKAREMSIYIRFDDFSDVGCAVKFTEAGLLVEGDIVSEPDTKNGFANHLKKGKRTDGAMEYWSNGVMELPETSPSTIPTLHHSIAPLLQHSNTPVVDNSRTRTATITMKKARPVGEFHPLRIARAVETIYWQLMRHHSKPVRQVCISFYDFLPLDLQPDLFGYHPEYKQRELHRAMERIEERYGRRKVVTGTRLLLQQRAPHLLGDRPKCPFMPQREVELKLENIPLEFDELTFEQETETSCAEGALVGHASPPVDATPLVVPRAWGRSTSRAIKFF